MKPEVYEAVDSCDWSSISVVPHIFCYHWHYPLTKCLFMLPKYFSSPVPDNKYCSAGKAKILEEILLMLKLLLKAKTRLDPVKVLHYKRKKSLKALLWKDKEF